MEKDDIKELPGKLQENEMKSQQPSEGLEVICFTSILCLSPAHVHTPPRLLFALLHRGPAEPQLRMSPSSLWREAM